jgi:energy-coupling factor transporter ATP-binding protein EcfA2
MDLLNAIFVFGPIVIAIYAFIIKPYLKRRGITFRATTKASPEGEVGAAQDTTQAISQATSEAPVGTRTWLDYVNAQPDQVPHVAVIGPSGAGKTTLTTAMLADRQGQIVVLTAKEGDTWGGLPYIGIDLDATYATANATFTALEAEVKQRLIAVKRKRMTADWLTIVVDDFSTLVKECPVASDVVKLVARLGRSLRVRLVMLSDSALVKAIGLEGEGETRSNFAFIRLQRGHIGTIEIEERQLPIDTSMVAQLAGRANLAQRAWQEPRDQEDELIDYLGLSGSEGGFSGVSDQTRPDQTRQTAQTGPSDRTLVRILHATGVSRDKAREALKAEGLGLDNKYWAELSKS